MLLQVKINKKLRDFTLSAEFETDSGVLAILGFSGAGKSMLLKCIAGVEKPDEGRIVLDGKVLFDSEERINLQPQERYCGYLFQDYSLFPHMTVRQNIEAGMRGRKELERLTELVKLFSIEGLEDRYPRELSGGQKQRAAIIRMLISDPECILLDEPFSALDTSLKTQLEYDLSDYLKKLGKPVLYVSHYPGEVFSFSDRAACISRGKLQEIREKHEFFSLPRTVDAARLIGIRNISRAENREDGLLLKDWNVFVPGLSSVKPFAAVKSEDLSVKTIINVEIPVDSYRINEAIDGYMAEIVPHGTDSRLYIHLDTLPNNIEKVYISEDSIIFLDE